MHFAITGEKESDKVYLNEQGIKLQYEQLESGKI